MRSNIRILLMAGMISLAAAAPGSAASMQFCTNYVETAVKDFLTAQR